MKLIIVPVALAILMVACSTPQGGREPEAALMASVSRQDPEDCPYGCPTGQRGNRVMIDRKIYTVLYNKETKFADWVSFSITKDTVGTSKPRNWKADDQLGTDDKLTEADWNDATEQVGYEKGHLALLTDFTGMDKEHWDESNILSNIAPQCGEFNIGPWGELEDHEKLLAKSMSKPVWIVVGTLYDHSMPALPNAKKANGSNKPHRVPSGFWKVIAVDTTDGLEVAAFSFDQKELVPDHCARGTFEYSTTYCDALVSLADVERAASIKLFPDITRSKITDISAYQASTLKVLGCDG